MKISSDSEKSSRFLVADKGPQRPVQRKWHRKKTGLLTKVDSTSAADSTSTTDTISISGTKVQL